MKLNKLMISMGLATAVLTGCGGGGSGSDADLTITAIDGYIVKGLVTTTCSYNGISAFFRGTTDESGKADINLTADGITYRPDECTSKVEGVEGTYDTDAPDVAWKHTMSTLPGLSVINPFTDVAATVLANNPDLSVAEVMGKVVEILNIPAGLVADGVDLFADFGANNADASGLDTVSLAKIAVLAQSTFAQTVKIKEALPANAAPAQVQAIYNEVLQQVTAAVVAQIALVGEDKLSDKVIVVTVNVPKIEFNRDGTIATGLRDLVVDIATTDKPDTKPVDTAIGATGATGTGGTGGTSSTGG